MGRDRLPQVMTWCPIGRKNRKGKSKSALMDVIRGTGEIRFRGSGLERQKTEKI